MPLFNLFFVPVCLLSMACSRRQHKPADLSAAAVVLPAPALPNTTDSVPDQVFFSTDNGRSWQNKSAGLSSTTQIGLGGIAIADGRIALLSKDSGLYIFNSSGNRWINAPTHPQLLKDNPAALFFYNGGFYAGTQYGGVFYSPDGGKTWSRQNKGLASLTVRRFAAGGGKLYVATNAGLYSRTASATQWTLEYGSDLLQVNGLVIFKNQVYLATNQGGFRSPVDNKNWKQIFSGGSLHNISADDRTVYAMQYNTLYASQDEGDTWQNNQLGLPRQLYTFNVLKSRGELLAAQWYGVYRKDDLFDVWKFSGKGLPSAAAVTNLIVIDGIVVAGIGRRGLKAGLSTQKWNSLF